MVLKKEFLRTSVIMSLLLLTACGDSNDEETPNEPEQEKVESPGNAQPTDEKAEQDEMNEQDSEGSDTSSLGNLDEETEASELSQFNLENEVFEPSSIMALVNKQYSLPEDYIPEDLVTVDVPILVDGLERNQLREEAAKKLKEMFEAAKDDGNMLYALSGYRSYVTQESIYANNVAKDGEEEANKYSAKPGESEHQTGLGMDITSESVNFQLTEELGNTKEGIWVNENAHRFGFIIRYPEGKTDITGYVYEPWHIRYIGEELATAIYESDLAYEEYLAKIGLNLNL